MRKKKTTKKKATRGVGKPLYQQLTDPPPKVGDVLTVERTVEGDELGGNDSEAPAIIATSAKLVEKLMRDMMPEIMRVAESGTANLVRFSVRFKLDVSSSDPALVARLVINPSAKWLEREAVIEVSQYQLPLGDENGSD